METKNELKWVTKAHYLQDYLLELTFNDGSLRIFDCASLIKQYKFFEPLQDKNVFADFKVDGWTVTWLDGAVDIAPEHLYENSTAA